ncbi:MAG: tRNA (5-methylaminomethyl-2-thiouridine)(34)-methyltransferase MnmD [Flavobacteriales bacterium]
MSNKLVLSKDGSHTLFSEHINEHYHSTHGARVESEYIFIEHGMRRSDAEPLRILEVGFGTGLNAFLTSLESKKNKRKVIYDAIEAYPVSEALYSKLNFAEHTADQAEFQLMHQSEWEQNFDLHEFMNITKLEVKFEHWMPTENYDLIYFDAFSPDKQPQMWSEEVFQRLFDHLNPGGFMTTYCAKGIIKRRLKAIGFRVECIPGPPKKREMTLAFRN